MNDISSVDRIFRSCYNSDGDNQCNESNHDYESRSNKENRNTIGLKMNEDEGSNSGYLSGEDWLRTLAQHKKAEREKMLSKNNEDSIMDENFDTDSFANNEPSTFREENEIIIQNMNNSKGKSKRTSRKRRFNEVDGLVIEDTRLLKRSKKKESI